MVGKTHQIKRCQTNNQVSHQLILNASSSSIFIQPFPMVNHQRLTPRLTTTISYINQPAPTQNTFFMSLFHIFSQWKNLDKKTQRKNPTEMNFPTVNCETRKKDCIEIHLFYQ